jgi:hypothetical protein
MGYFDKKAKELGGKISKSAKTEAGNFTEGLHEAGGKVADAYHGIINDPEAAARFIIDPVNQFAIGAAEANFPGIFDAGNAKLDTLKKTAGEMADDPYRVARTAANPVGEYLKYNNPDTYETIARVINDPLSPLHDAVNNFAGDGGNYSDFGSDFNDLGGPDFGGTGAGGTGAGGSGIAFTPLGESAFAGITEDEALRNNQMKSVYALDDIINAGGFTAADQANLARLRSQEAQADRGRREAIQSNFAQRGMSSTPNELLAQLSSSQAATSRDAQRSLDTAGLAQQRMLDANTQRAQVAGNVRAQDYGQKAQAAEAADRIKQFNATNSFQESQQKAGIAQQGFDNKVRVAELKQKAKVDAAAAADRVADRKAGIYGNVLGSATKLGAAGIMADAASDERLKQDIEPIDHEDLDEFFAALVPSKYEYKDGHGPGEKPGLRIGLIAQDVEDTDLGKDLVKKDEGGMRTIDNENLLGIILAALAEERD